MERNDPAAPAADDDNAVPTDMVDDGKGAAAGGANAGGEDEEFARRLGWRPKEEFRGPTDKWLPHDEFLDKVQKETPVLRERLRFQDEVIRKQQEQIATIESRSKEQGDLLRELIDRSRGAEQRGFQYAREQLEDQMDRAARDADFDAYQRAKAQLRELDKLKPQAKEEKGQQPAANPNADPVTVAWVAENKWFNTNEEMMEYAISTERRLVRSEPNLSTRERLDKVKERVMKRFPEEFENSARSSPAAVGKPGPQAARTPARKNKTAADLPPDARAAMERLVRQKVLTEKQYLDSFKWD